MGTGEEAKFGELTWAEDVDRLHELWLRLTREAGFGSKLHHRDVVGLALRRLEKELSGEQRQDVVRELGK